jgi:CubicO group peptidase (beta-lactamase class C family)
MRYLTGFAAIASALLLGLGALAQQPAIRPAASTPPAPIVRTSLAAAGDVQLTPEDAGIWLDGFMPYALRRGDIAGATVAVVRNGEVIALRGYGVADVATGRPVDPAQTMFRPGSISKLFVWTAVMQLVEQGRLDLDRDVNAYLDFTIPAPDGQPLTLRNIMTHRPGFEEWLRGLIYNGPDQMAPLGEALRRRIPARIFPPGSTPAYSNYATALAGYIVERASGQPFETYVERHILAPLGMSHSSFRQPLPPALQRHMSQGYARASGRAMPYEFVGIAPAGSLATTGGDMARFMIAHLDENGGALLRPATKRMMHRTITRALPGLNGMALGFYQQNINGRQVISHGGATQWFKSNLWLFIDDGVGLFVSLNSAGAGDSSAAIHAALIEGFADRYFPAQATRTRIEPATARRHAEEIAGTYVSSRRAETGFLKLGELFGQPRISVDGEGRPVTPFAPAAGGGARRWVEIAPYLWEDTTSHARFAARVENGRATRIGFDSSPVSVLEPAPWYSSSAWLLPAFMLALGTLFLTGLSWPVAAIARRRFGAALALEGQDRNAYRLVRLFAWIVSLVFAGWILALSMLEDLDNINGGLDWLIRPLLILGAIGIIGLAAAAPWNLWRTWKGRRGWIAKLWGLLLTFAALVMLWIAVVFHLFNFSLSY